MPIFGSIRIHTMKKTILLFLLFAVFTGVRAQTTQTIRGKVADKESKYGLVGVAVALYKDSALIGGATTDANGNYRIGNVEPGRYNLRARYLGYAPFEMKNLVVNAGKEPIINIDLEEMAMKVDEVEVVANKKEGTINEMTSVSGRTFSVEETNRYAGSRGDPARMASNFAGVQGADDSRNDIVVRGNSPMGVLWRLEGVDIPNPNHFAIEGTTGGPVSILNNKVLDNSDFMTGAFPAEYGNSIAGVFDLRMRNGNNEKHEFTGQFGFLGTELTAEGPISREKRSSYMVNYRYSTLKLFESLNIPIGTGAVPKYQDGAFKLNFPTKKGANISLFGVGGASKIAIIVSDYTELTEEFYGEGNRDQYFNTNMAVTGAVYAKSLNENTYLRMVAAYSHKGSSAHHFLVWRDTAFGIDSITEKMGYKNTEDKYSYNLTLTRKFGSRGTLKAGVFSSYFNYFLIDSNRSEITYQFYNRQDYSGGTFLVQPFAQYKYKITDNLVLNAGVHGQYYGLNENSLAIEPRAGLRWTPAPRHTLSLGYGMHSQVLPSYIYYMHLPSNTKPYYLHNEKLGFTKSSHYVFSYDWSIAENLRLKMETYYQNLWDVPVDNKPSSFSALNQGTGFSRFFPDTLVNEGTGRNYGVEVTIEKFFSKGYLFMLTGSFYDARYKGSDGIERNSDFNGKYAANLLFAKEIKLGDRQSLQIGTKITTSGGRWYTPIDTAASRIESDEVYIDSLRNSLQLPDYFRIDAKINWKMNAKKKKITHEIGLDLINVTARENILAITYSPNPTKPSENPLHEQYQLGFLPLFYYSIDF
ncbi:MAG: TonB-dependent receptor [Bacteroidetes bacterium]|nr:MAG: TonB-dependent receptor [Bacteroidota bacterium]